MKIIKGKRIKTEIIENFVALQKDINKALELYGVNQSHLAIYMCCTRQHITRRKKTQNWTLDEIILINNYLHK